jgi:hypothetical protein
MADRAYAIVMEDIAAEERYEQLLLLSGLSPDTRKISKMRLSSFPRPKKVRTQSRRLTRQSTQYFPTSLSECESYQGVRPGSELR